MRRLPRRLTPIALASLLALVACTGPQAEGDDAGTPGSGAAPTAGASAPAEAGDAAGERAKDPSAYTVPHADDHKTIVTMDRSQVEALTGTDLGAGVHDAQRAMTQADTWAGDATADHVDLVTAAAERESDGIERVLSHQADGRDVELRLTVVHHEHAQEAHFGEDDD